MGTNAAVPKNTACQQSGGRCYAGAGTRRAGKQLSGVPTGWRWVRCVEIKAVKGFLHLYARYANGATKLSGGVDRWGGADGDGGRDAARLCSKAALPLPRWQLGSRRWLGERRVGG